MIFFLFFFFIFLAAVTEPFSQNSYNWRRSPLRAGGQDFPRGVRDLLRIEEFKLDLEMPIACLEAVAWEVGGEGRKMTFSSKLKLGTFSNRWLKMTNSLNISLSLSVFFFIKINILFVSLSLFKIRNFKHKQKSYSIFNFVLLVSLNVEM